MVLVGTAIYQGRRCIQRQAVAIDYPYWWAMREDQAEDPGERHTQLAQALSAWREVVACWTGAQLKK